MKCTAFDNFQLLKNEENTANSLIRSILLHPKLETERLLSRNMRNRSLNDIKKTKN